MSFIVPFLPLIAAGIAAIAVIKQGQAAKAAGEFNAAMGRQNAAFTREQTTVQAQQQARENYMRLGAIRAAHGKSGGVANEGNVLDIIGDAASQGELQRQQILRSGEIKAWNEEAGANLDLAAGKNAEQASYLQAGAALIGGASSYYGSMPKSSGTSYGSGSITSAGAARIGH